MSDKKKRIKQNNQEITHVLTALKLVFKKAHLWLISGAIVAICVFLVVSIFIKPSYEAQTTFFVYNVSDTSSVNNSDVQAAKNLATSYSKILKNSAVLDAIVDEIKDTKGYERKELREAINVSVVQDTQLIEITVKTDNPDLSYKIANSAVNVAPKEILRVAKVGSVEVINMPEMPTKKASPNTVYDTAIGFVCGVLVTFCLMYLKFYSEEIIFSEDDVNSFVGIPVIGQIPAIRNESKNNPFILKKAGVVSYENKVEKERRYTE